MSDALVGTWDGFLRQIEYRFCAIMADAREGCIALLRKNKSAVAMGNAWSAIEIRADELARKVDETWRESMEPRFEEAGASESVILREAEKGEALVEWMQLERERTRIGIYGDAASIVFADAKAKMGTWSCTRCGRSLDVPFVFRLVNLACPHCMSVNSYEPAAALRTLEAVAMHPLCEARAWNEFVAMRAAEKTWRESRPPTLEALKTYERAQIAYWTAYLKARSQLLPDTAKDFDKDLRGRMAHHYLNIENEGVWAKAGRPRELA